MTSTGWRRTRIGSIFLLLDKAATERQMESAIVDRISEFLTHLGRGFAYMGRQFRLTVGQTDFIKIIPTSE